MSTLIDINVPYSGGTIGSIDDNNVGTSNGFAWCWFGGNNNRKIFSLRMQTDEDYWFVEVSEVDDLQAKPMTKSVLYTRAIPSAGADFYTTYYSTLEMCRLSSSAVYLKLPLNDTGTGNNSHHYVIEIDEDNGNEVSVTNVNDQMPDWLRGSMANSTSAPYSNGDRIHHRFMHQLGENKIVTYEANTGAQWGYGSLVERSWDPVTKSLTNRVVLQNGQVPNVRTDATYRLSSNGYGDTWSFVPELDKPGFEYISPTNADPTRVKTSGVSSWPTLTGRYSSNYTGETRLALAWFTVTTGRDGLIHFNMGTENSNGYNTTQDWININVDMDAIEYVFTYNPTDGSWGVTGRGVDAGDSNLSASRDDYGIWLPLNVKSSESYMTEQEMDPSEFDGVDNSRVCKTWIFIGASMQQVVGVETGSPQSHVDALTAVNAIPAQAYQAVWLDYDHFIVFGWKNISQVNSHTNHKNNQLYAIYRYYDENKIDLVSAGQIDDPANTNPTIQQMNASNVFQRPTINTFLSDKFASSLITLSAGQG
jgi:hypothetical protein